LSSHAETLFSLESDEPERLPFDLEAVLANVYNYKEIQKTYYIMDGFESLYALSHDNRIKELCDKLEGDQDAFVIC
jgi:phenylalanine-4-hydroxylase